tara:strand:+ start:2567 stop:3460 length:894 start_codon:yes stop_codon:yes gene_type:complete
MSLDGKENQSKYLDKDELAQIRFIVRSAVSKPDLIMSIRTYLSNIQKNKSTRQINRYINQYGDGKEEVDPKDKQIDWHNLSYFHELGIDRAHLNIIRNVVSWLSRWSVGPLNNLPTYRWAQWCSYLITYANDALDRPIDYWALAEYYLRLDYAIQNGAGDRWVKALEARDSWLTHRPWVSPERENQYLRLISEGKIEPLDDLQITRTDVTTIGQEDKNGLSFTVSANHASIAEVMMRLRPDKLWELPSNQLVYWHQQRTEKEEPTSWVLATASPVTWNSKGDITHSGIVEIDFFSEQ